MGGGFITFDRQNMRIDKKICEERENGKFQKCREYKKKRRFKEI